MLLNKIKRSSGSPELVIGYKQFLVLFQIVNHDLLGFACVFRVRLEFDIVLLLLYEIEWSPDVSEPLISYKQYLLTFKLYNPDLLGFACEFQVSSKFYKIVKYSYVKSSGVPEARNSLLIINNFY